jgi:hypothetical protein
MNYLLIIMTLILGVFTGLRILNLGLLKLSAPSWKNKNLNEENFQVFQVPHILSRILHLTNLEKLNEQIKQSYISVRTFFISTTFYPLIYFPIFLILYFYGKLNFLNLVPLLLIIELSFYLLQRFLKKEISFLRNLSFVLYGLLIIFGTLQFSFTYSQVLKALFTEYEISYLLFDSSLTISLFFAGLAFLSALFGALDFMLLFWGILLTQGLVHIHLIWIFAVSGFMSELLLNLIQENTFLKQNAGDSLKLRSSIFLYSTIMFAALVILTFLLTPFLSVFANSLITSENSDSFQRKDQWVLALLSLQIVNISLRSLVGHFWYELKMKTKV